MLLAELSRSFLHKRGVPSKISGLTPGLLSQNLHFPLGGVIPVHPSLDIEPQSKRTLAFRAWVLESIVLCAF